MPGFKESQTKSKKFQPASSEAESEPDSVFTTDLNQSQKASDTESVASEVPSEPHQKKRVRRGHKSKNKSSNGEPAEQLNDTVNGVVDSVGSTADQVANTANQVTNTANQVTDTANQITNSAGAIAGGGNEDNKALSLRLDFK
ncbi:hypothetical protein INT43_007775 [Umbelopsis isabellina]|uniref:Uncharacterized protein n=1 Tax=Mortierella isabellina TaxID=91625 RepID=A0A8H7PMU7_MORIS|nr:hypothetical protein INT43_007775 [Umbelopsis isabellina]